MSRPFPKSPSPVPPPAASSPDGQSHPGFTRFYVTIDYRTKRGLAFWSGAVPAADMTEAGDIAERELRRRCRRAACFRVDRIVVR